MPEHEAIADRIARIARAARPALGAAVQRGLVGLFGSLALAGCMESLDGPIANRVPTALAQVQGQMGSQVTVPFMGAPVQVTLDASGSTDQDGPLVAYRWFSGTPQSDAPSTAGSGADDDAGAESGSGRWVPDGAPKDWPNDELNPVVTLGEGQYSFVLWVIDELGAVSDPSTLTVTVATPLEPAVQACVVDVVDTVPMQCKVCVCGVSDMCRAAAVETMCNADCWGLIRCIGSMCPGFMPGGDNSCVLAECAEYLAGAAASGMVAPCLPTCLDSCRAP
jgi:hypothetical protein